MQAVQAHGATSPEAKMKIASEILPLIGKIKNVILRHEWIKHLAEKLHTTEEVLMKEWQRKYANTAVIKSSSPSPSIKETKRTVIRTAEEEILQLIASHPQCRIKVKESVFSNDRNRFVYSLLIQNIPVSEIMGMINEADINWYTELLLEEKVYSTPEQMLDHLLKELRRKVLESQRQTLSKEVVLMMEGKIPSDQDKIQLYQELNKQLKGSVKEL
jgi:DNA primase